MNGTRYWILAREAEINEDGRVAAYFIDFHLFGPNAITARVNQLDQDIASITYHGDRRNWTFESMIIKMKSIFAQKDALHKRHEKTNWDGGQRVQFLLNAIRDPTLEPAKASTMCNPDMMSDFDKASRHIQDFINHVRHNSPKNRNISGVDTDRGGGRGRGGGGGRGRGSGGRSGGRGGRGRGRGRGRGGGDWGRDRRGPYHRGGGGGTPSAEEVAKCTHISKIRYDDCSGWTAAEKRKLWLNQQANNARIAAMEGRLYYPPSAEQDDMSELSTNSQLTGQLSNLVSALQTQNRTIAALARQNTGQDNEPEGEEHPEPGHYGPGPRSPSNRNNPALVRQNAARRPGAGR